MTDFDSEEPKMTKKKRRNIFARFSQRISRLFTRGKYSDKKSALSDYKSNAQISKSDDNLNISAKSKFKAKKKYGKSLNPSKSNSPSSQIRCLSEGNLVEAAGDTHDINDDAIETANPSQPGSTSGVEREIMTNGNSAFSTGDLSRKNLMKLSLNSPIDQDNNSHQSRNHFKSELAKKLKLKSNPNVSDDSVDSPEPNTMNNLLANSYHNATLSGTSPSRAESQTPRSLSSLSHSSNSLLSTGPLSGETESMMSRSVIEGTNDELAINVDLNTPLNKTTNASLLDSTAARHKIATSRARRVRPKSINPATKSDDSLSDFVMLDLDKKDKTLEEIEEEESINVPFNKTNITKDEAVASDKLRPIPVTRNVKSTIVNSEGNIVSNDLKKTPQILTNTHISELDKVVFRKSTLSESERNSDMDVTKPAQKTVEISRITLRKSTDDEKSSDVEVAKPVEKTEEISRIALRKVDIAKPTQKSEELSRITLRKTVDKDTDIKKTVHKSDDISKLMDTKATELEFHSLDLKKTQQPEPQFNRTYLRKKEENRSTNEIENAKSIGAGKSLKSEEVASSSSSVLKVPNRYVSHSSNVPNENNINSTTERKIFRENSPLSDSQNDNKRQSRVMDMVKNINTHHYVPSSTSSDSTANKYF